MVLHALESVLRKAEKSLGGNITLAKVWRTARPEDTSILGRSWIIIGLNSCSIVTVGDLGKFDTACSHSLSHQLTGISSHACDFTLLGSFHLGACCTCCTLRTLQRGWGTLATGLGPSGSENYWTESAGHLHPAGPCRSNCFGLGLCFGMWEVVKAPISDMTGFLKGIYHSNNR